MTLEAGSKTLLMSSRVRLCCVAGEDEMPSCFSTAFGLMGLIFSDVGISSCFSPLSSAAAAVVQWAVHNRRVQGIHCCIKTYLCLQSDLYLAL